MIVRRRNPALIVGAAAAVLLAGACSGPVGDPTAATFPPTTTVITSTTTADSDPTIVSTIAPTAPPTADSSPSSRPIAMPPLSPGEPVAFSLPPAFVAMGVNIPLVVWVNADIDAAAVEVLDATGGTQAELSPLSAQFWSGTIPGGSVTGSDLSLIPVAHTADGASVRGGPISVVVLPRNGATLERRVVSAETNTVYDRPWSSELGELDHIPAEREGVSTNPPGLARVDDDEVAVLDIAAQRVTCYDLAGNSTCTVPLPIDASGDMFPLGDGTLAAIDLGNRDGSQELHVLRIDPHAELVEVIYHEFPLQVTGYPGIAVNTRFTWDDSSRTAWVSIPEASPPSAGEPDPSRFPYTDALHLDPDGVTRGPTVQRSAPRPDIVHVAPTSFRLLDGNTWVTFYDAPAPYYDLLGQESTETGVVWMLVGIGNNDGGPGATELVRWRPGDDHFDAFPIEFHLGEDYTRRIAAMDDETAVVLDVTTGGRIRAFTFPPLQGG